MIEVLFLFSAFQCGASAPQATFSVELDQNHTIYQGESVLLDIDEQQLISNLIVNYEENAECINTNPVFVSLSNSDEVPHVSGAYNQTSLQELKAQYLTEDFYRLYLIELGTTDPNLPIYDLQDVVILVNLNPNPYPAD